MHKARRAICAGLVAFVLTLGFPAALQAARVAVVKSDALPAYNELVSSYAVQSGDTLSEYNLAKNVALGRKVFAQLAAQPPDLLLAVGPLAAALAHEIMPRTPMVFVLLPDTLAAELRDSAATGIAMNAPALTQLKLLKQLNGELARVGVVHGMADDNPVLNDARQAALRLGIGFVDQRIASATELESALAHLQGRVDALWLLPDDMLLSPTSHAAFVKFAGTERLPFMTLTPGLVKLGGLFALAPDYAALGAQAVRVSDKILRGGIKPEALPISEPEGLQIAFNLGMAEKIGRATELAPRLLGMAAAYSFPLMVFK